MNHERHPSIFEPPTLLLGLAMAVLGAIIGLEILTRVGITPNSSIIAAVATIAVSRVLSSFRSLERQNLMQTVISGATFGAANGMLLPLGVIWLIGRTDLILVMLLGAVLGLVVDAVMLYRLFDSTLYPASGSWPSGVATAECLIAGDRGGRRAALLGAGGLAGIVGRLVGIPMDIVGVCWIGNIWALTMFGIGLLVRGYSVRLFGASIEELYVPHGMMIGAGPVALGQFAYLIKKRTPASSAGRSEARVGRSLIAGWVAFALAASIIAALAGLATQMSAPWLVAFVVFAAVAALVSELIVGIAAMHSGWFPAFATALIFLVLGMAMGFAPLPLAFLVGFTASTGPAFADMGYDLKAGWILRGRGEHPDYEREGRRRQFAAELVGFTVAALIVLLFHESYFARELIPPVSRVYATTIQAGTTPGLVGQLLVWAVPGAVLQLVGGPSRQVGILFATGLLILNPTAGWTALVALTLRVVILRHFGTKAEGTLYVVAGGFIAGSALSSFTSATLRLR